MFFLVFEDENKAFSLKDCRGCHIFLGSEFKQDYFIEEGFVCSNVCFFLRLCWTWSILWVQRTQMILLAGSRGVGVWRAAPGMHTLGTEQAGLRAPYAV